MARKFNQLKKKKQQAPQPPKANKTQSSASKSTTKSSLDSNSTSSNASGKETTNTNIAPDWLIYAQEEIHTLIAQRHFEEALSLITKCEEYFAKDSSFVNATEIINKVQSIFDVFLDRSNFQYSCFLL